MELAVMDYPNADTMRVAYGRALAQALLDAGISQVEFIRRLNEMIGTTYKPSIATEWKKGRSDLSARVVFATERVLGVEPGGLARHFANVPFGSAEWTLDDLPGEMAFLDKDQRRALMDFIRAMVRSRDAGTGSAQAN